MFRRHAFVRQFDQSDCGAAALATVAVHYRTPIGLQQMRDLCGTDRIGTNLLGLQQAAERLGFEARAVQATAEALPQVPLPAIAHTTTSEGLGHFVVVYRVGPKSVTIADPATEVETLSREEFAARWTGYLLLLTPKQLLAPAGPAPAGPLRRFLGLLAYHRLLLVEAVLASLLMTVLGLSTAYFIQHLIDSVLVRNEVRLLNALGIGMLAILVFRVLFGLLRKYLLAHVGLKVDLALIAGYARHVLGLPMSFFETRQVGEILSRVHDADKVREAVSGATMTVVVDGLLVVVFLVVLWFYDVRLALVATAFVPLLLLSAAGHHSSVRRRSRTAMEHAALLSSHLVEDVSAVETVKAYGAERQRAEEGEARLVRVVKAGFSLQALAISMTSIGMFLTGLAGIVILWYGGYRVMAGALSLGQLVFFHTLLGHMLDPLERLSTVNLQIQDALVAVERLFQITDLPGEPIGTGRKSRFTGVRTAIELRDVGFRYSSRGNVLEGLNLTIPGGKTVAVIGESGSGKSTLLKLLLGFHMPTEGELLIDGTDVRDIDLASLRGGIGMVAQDPYIFNGSVFDNIALGRPGATMNEVVEAARVADMAEFINSLPERYDTLLGERGANLSGGQRQRLAIARAILRQPEVLIFDEATSHLDTATERAVQEGLRTVLAGKTAVLVAHRLSTIKEADLIYVLHQGRVLEQGTHRQLLAQEGRYAELWRAQVGGEDGRLAAEPAMALR